MFLIGRMILPPKNCIKYNRGIEMFSNLLQDIKDISFGHLCTWCLVLESSLDVKYCAPRSTVTVPSLAPRVVDILPPAPPPLSHTETATAFEALEARQAAAEPVMPAPTTGRI